MTFRLTMARLALYCAVAWLAAPCGAWADYVGLPLDLTGENSSGYVASGVTRYLSNDALNPSCRDIANNSQTGMPLYVPAFNQAEWSSFLAKPPAGVTISACQEEVADEPDTGCQNFGEHGEGACFNGGNTTGYGDSDNNHGDH